MAQIEPYDLWTVHCPWTVQQLSFELDSSPNAGRTVLIDILKHRSSRIICSSELPPSVPNFASFDIQRFQNMPHILTAIFGWIEVIDFNVARKLCKASRSGCSLYQTDLLVSRQLSVFQPNTRFHYAKAYFLGPLCRREFLDIRVYHHYEIQALDLNQWSETDGDTIILTARKVGEVSSIPLSSLQMVRVHVPLGHRTRFYS